MAVRTESLGPASLGFPFNGAALAGSRLVISSRNLVPARLAVYDLSTGRGRNGPVVPTGNGAWGMTAVGDTVYLGQAGTAAGENVLYRYEISANRLSPIGPLDADYVWSLAASASGFVYGAAGGPDRVVLYDPRNGSVSDLGLTTPGDGLRAITVSGYNLVYGGSRGGRAFLRTARIGALQQRRSILTPQLANHVFLYCVAAGSGAVAAGTQGPASIRPGIAILDAQTLTTTRVARLGADEALVDTVTVAPDAVYATSRPSGALYRIDRASGAVRRLAVPVPGAETRALFFRSGAVIGVSAAERVWRYTVATARLELFDLPGRGVTPGPEQGQSISSGGGTVAVGGNFGVQVRRVADRATRRYPTPGEPKDQAVINGERFLAVYPTAQIVVMGLDLGAAPVRRVQLPREQNRPVCIHHDERTNLVCCGTASDARGGGALHVFSPSGQGLRTFVDVIARDQFVSRISSEDGLAFLTGGSSNPSLVAWDLAASREKWRIDGLGAGIGTVTGVVPAFGRVHLLTQEGWWIVVDRPTLSVVSRTRIGPSGGRMLPYNGRLTAVDRTSLFDLDLITGQRTDIVTGLNPVVFGNPFLALGGGTTRYVIRGTDLLRVDEV